MTEAPAHQRRVLILGGSTGDVPLIEAAKRRGWFVITSGNRPADRGHALGDTYEPADYSQFDEVLAVARKNSVDSVIAACNDFAALSAAFVAEELGLPGHDSLHTALQIHHKDKLREVMRGIGAPTPDYDSATSTSHARAIAKRIRYPVMVKPVDLTGGKGVSVCGDPVALDRAVGRALAQSRQTHIVVEKYLEGSRHGFSCLIKSGRVEFAFADDEQYYLNPFLVSGTVTPSALSESDIAELTRVVDALAAKLRLVDGLVHTQLIRTSEGPVIIEVCRRCPGDRYPDFVTLATGFPFADAIVAAESGAGVNEAAYATSQPTARVCVMPPRNGTVSGVTWPTEFDRHVVMADLVSAPVTVTDFMSDKLGFVFLRFADELQMRSELPRFRRSIEIAFDSA